MIRERWLGGRSTSHFTLQWHLTNSCPYSCAHCYDRSSLQELTWPEAVGVVVNLKRFCDIKRVSPRVSLSGGDPLHYPHFWNLYALLADQKIPVSILGNPVPLETVQHLASLRMPVYYQVSLEGLREHNDRVRGRGHYDAVLNFLRAARQEGMETHVMLTLTRENCAQVLPLAEQLRGLTARFTFNRLAQVGQGANLELPSQDIFMELLQAYVSERRNNPVLGFKDNLFNPVGRNSRFRGCTGFGCGAAFNFLALLPNGEVHACRKFPSWLGNVKSQPLAEIYELPAARLFRQGPAECRQCRHNKVCRGCLAVTYGMGLDPLKQRDPFCPIELPEYFDCSAV